MTLRKKRDVRRSVQQPGWIILDGGFATRACQVLDLSATGAKLTMDDTAILSSSIKLAFSRDGRGARSCNVVWRRGKTLGVRFTDR
jgi:hypothetical protein